MAGRRDRGERWRFAWRVGVMSFVVLSMLALAAGWAITLFDDQYEASSVAERAVVGVFAGAFGALLVSPITALVSLIAGAVAWVYRGRSAHGTGSPSTT